MRRWAPHLRRFRSSRRLVAAAVLLVLALTEGAGCAPREEAPAQLRIGLLTELALEDGEPTLRGARLAVAQANEAGLTLDGRPYEVVLLEEDTHNQPAGATRAVLKLINEEEVVALIGSSRSPNAIPAANVASAAGVPIVSPASTHPETTAGKPYSFRVLFTNELQGKALARFAREDLGAASAAVLFDVANSYSSDMAAVFQAAFEAAGGRVTAAEPYTTGALDFRDQLLRIKEAAPEVLFLPNYTDDVLPQAGQARELGLGARFLGTDGWAGGRVAEHPDLEGSFLGSGWHRGAAELSEPARAFIERYRRAYGLEPTFNVSVLTYDAVGLLLAATRAAGRPDRKAIRDALASLEGYAGASGTITYRDTGGDPQRPVAILQVRDGDVHLVKLARP